MVSDIRRLVSLRSFFQAGDMEVSTIEKKTSRVLNEMLVKLFNNIMDAEEKAIITEEYKDITNNDMHIIEAIGIEVAPDVRYCETSECDDGHTDHQHEQP